MHILITYNDGSSEELKVDVDAIVQPEPQGFLLVDEPRHCHWGADYFSMAIVEGRETSGECQPEEADIDPETRQPCFMGFRWEVVGTPADACIPKLMKWGEVLGEQFNPYTKGSEYLLPAPTRNSQLGLRVLDDDQASRYDRDMECCLRYLGQDPAEVWAELRSTAGASAPSL